LLLFDNKADKKELENELYQHLEFEFKKKLKTMPGAKYLFYDVPLLFENSLEKKIDYTVSVYVNSNLQIKRLRARDNIDKALAEKTISNQIEIERKKELTDFVIDNSGSLEDTKKQVKDLLVTIEKLYCS